MSARRIGQSPREWSGRDGPIAHHVQPWLQARVKLMPDLLIQSPPWVRAVFDHAWVPVRMLAQQVQCLPSALWAFLLSCQGGYVVLTPGESQYTPGPATLRRRTVQNVAWISIQDLAQNSERPLHIIGHLIDHHLGCAGEEGAWFSEGGGVVPIWREEGARLQGLFALGYGVDEIARLSLRDYFAQSLAYYCRNRKHLNMVDPPMERWLRHTLWNRSFWQVAVPGQRSSGT